MMMMMMFPVVSKVKTGALNDFCEIFIYFDSVEIGIKKLKYLMSACLFNVSLSSLINK